MFWWASSSSWSPLGYCCGGVDGNCVDEHSAVNPRPDSIRITAWPNPGDDVGVAVVQGAVMNSTTQVFPNTKNGHTLPSLTYASNVGPDATVVYNAAITGIFSRLQRTRTLPLRSLATVFHAIRF
jgi:hypothetical protein